MAGVILAIALIGGLLAVAVHSDGHSSASPATTTSSVPTTTTSTPPRTTTTTRTATTTRKAPRSTTTTTRPVVSAGGLPAGEWHLPEGDRTLGEINVGFPHTTLGAVGRAIDAFSGSTTFSVGVIATILNEAYVGVANPTSAAEGVVRTEMKDFNVTASSVPTASLSFVVEGCQVSQASSTRVQGSVEGVVYESDPVNGSSSAQVVSPFLAVWRDNDWKLEVGNPHVGVPTYQVPTAGGVSANGWHACIEE